MDTLPPYEIDVYNRAAQDKVGTYVSNQVPAVGDHINFVGDRVDGAPYEGWGHWKVDVIVWPVAETGSQIARDLARTHRGTGRAVCTRAEVHVWPAEGPWFTGMPKWLQRPDPEP